VKTKWGTARRADTVARTGEVYLIQSEF